MTRLALLMPLITLTGCGESVSQEAETARSNGEIQALANAEAMLATREDEETEAGEPAPPPEN